MSPCIGTIDAESAVQTVARLSPGCEGSRFRRPMRQKPWRGLSTLLRVIFPSGRTSRERDPSAYAMRVCKPRIVSGCGHVGALARWWFLQDVRSRRLSVHFFAIFLSPTRRMLPPRTPARSSPTSSPILKLAFNPVRQR